MATLACKVKRTQAAAFKSYCADQGQTSNTALKNYVLDCIGEGENLRKVSAGERGILSPDTLKAAQEAAKAAGEAVLVFVARAVETQARWDALFRKMKGGQRQ